MTLKTGMQNDFDLTEIINEEKRVTPTPLAHQRLVAKLSQNSKIFGKTSSQRNDLISYDVILEEEFNRILYL